MIFRCWRVVLERDLDMMSKADDLWLYAAAYAGSGCASDRRAAAEAAGYLLDTLRSEHGAFFSGADAAPGCKTDRHLYARENGWAIRALAYWARISGDDR
jgi:uncharacterized protein YyaL (SSP411 family)